MLLLFYNLFKDSSASKKSHILCEMPIFVGVLCLHEKKTFQKYKQKLVICVQFSGFTDGKIIGGEKNGMEWYFGRCNIYTPVI